MQYLDPSLVDDVKCTPLPRKGQTLSGYGNQMPTAFMLHIDNQWQRVYVIQWSNAGTMYVLRKKEKFYLNFNPAHLIKGHYFITAMSGGYCGEDVTNTPERDCFHGTEREALRAAAKLANDPTFDGDYVRIMTVDGEHVRNVKKGERF